MPEFHRTRAAVAAIVLAVLAHVVLLAQNAGSAAACTVSGLITANRVPLPGVALTVTAASGEAVDATSSAPDGSYTIRLPGPGTYTLSGELVAFAKLTAPLEVEIASCHQRIDFEMALASRAPVAGLPAPHASASGSAPSSPATAASRPNATTQARQAGRGRGGVPGGSFQALTLVADQNNRDDENGSGTESASKALLPPGFSVEASGESVTALGSMQSGESLFGQRGFGGPDQFRDQFGGDGNAAGGGRGGFAGGRAGGPGGDFAGFGGFGGRGFGRGRGNQVRGSIFQSFDTSAFDAAPYSLNGQPTTKPSYLQQRFGATLGGPLAIPKLFTAPRTFFFLNYTGNHSSSPFDQYSTVPTVAERSGDLSALGRPVIDPATRTPFPGNQIPIDRINQASAQLLGLIPLPNQAGTTQNFHTVTTATNQLDDINIRVIHMFGADPPPGRGFGGGRGGGGGGRGGLGGRGGSNLNVAVHFRHGDNGLTNPFPTLGGNTTTTAWDVPVGYSFTKAGITSTIRAQFNRLHSETTNLYASVQDIAGEAGLLGVSADPFDWGAPNLSFSTYQGVRDVVPATRTDRTIAIGDLMTRSRGAHTVRFGGDYRDLHTDSRTDPNARGSYVFTGLYTGSDLGDFLLGYPQQATAQYGPGLEQYRSRTWDLFLQDDWRVSPNMTVNAGIRYEYFAPYSEANGRLVTLDAAPDFTAVAPVPAGGTGPYSGALPDSIVRPYRKGFAPRVAIAWKPQTSTIVRAGVGINYSNTYQAIVSQLAAQPPFAIANTLVQRNPLAPVPLESALVQPVPGGTYAIDNTYGVDPNYVLPRVAIWNLDLQRDLSRTVTIGIGYMGSTGSNLDVLRAPNRTATGLLIPGAAPFLWESSGADSIMHSMSVRLRKRLTKGVAAGFTYTLSKSIDDASSIGGGGTVVAQNDQDLAAERGLSSFDQRHRFGADFTLELPFGENKPWFNDGVAAHLLGGWVVNGNVQLATGTPFTARVLGSIADVARGVNGTLRADYNGQPIALPNPTTEEFFNTGAFSIPAPGTYGNAGRNTIIGPGTTNVNMSLIRNINLGQTRGLSVQLLANNVFNTVQYATIDTVINSPTFGQVIATRPMRRIQILTRFRF